MRRNIYKIYNNQSFLLLCLIFVLCTISVFVKNQQFYDEENRVELVKNLQSTTASNILIVTKHVTKSLSELGRMDEINRYVLFLNHIRNSGAEILIFLLQKLQGSNNYRHVRLEEQTKRLNRIQEENLVDRIYEIIRNAAVPISFDQPVRYINFTSYDKQSPTFINLIREPTDKILSRSLYANQEDIIGCFHKKIKNCYRKYYQQLNVAYFCGHDPRCDKINDPWRLQMAKNNVVKYYSVVGVSSELNTTLEILENRIPYFFKGVTKLYRHTLIGKYNRKKQRLVDASFEKQLKSILGDEYEFYEWIRKRLFQQLQILYGPHHSH